MEATCFGGKPLLNSRSYATPSTSNEEGGSSQRLSSDDERTSVSDACVSCPQHGVRISQTEVSGTAEPHSARRLVTHRHRVYDITTFQHPGGNDLLAPYVGKDITDAFAEVGHSASAEKILSYLCVGILTEEALKYQSAIGTACTCSFSDTCAPAPCSMRRRATAPNATDGASDTSTATENKKAQYETGTDAKAHSLIDFSKPLVPQIYYLNNADYRRVVDTPYCKDTVFQLLPWPRLEPMTKTKWWWVVLFWTPIIFALIYTALQRMSVLAFCSAYAVGLFLWTFLEYLLHRFVFHYPEENLPDFGWVRVVHFLVHAVHHMLPMDPLRLVMPPALLISLSVPVLSFFLLILPNWFVHGAWSGGLTGYLMYDMIHYTTHHCAFLERWNYIREMKKYHMKHHFRYPSLGFGVSSKFWDYVFGTVIPKA